MQPSDDDDHSPADEVVEGGRWEQRTGYRVFVPDEAPRRAVSATDPPAPTAPTAPWTTSGAPAPAETDGVAIAALVLGIMGVLGLPFGIWAKRRIRRSGAGGSGMATAGIVLGSCYLVFLIAFGAFLAVVLTRDKAELAPNATPVTAAQLAVGQCLLGVVDGSDELMSVVPCTQSHEAEVFAVLPVRAAAYPGAKALDAKANDGCPAPFLRYVGEPTAASGQLEVIFFYPQATGWALGHRSVSCLLTDADADRLIRSAKAR